MSPIILGAAAGAAFLIWRARSSSDTGSAPPVSDASPPPPVSEIESEERVQEQVVTTARATAVGGDPNRVTALKVEATPFARATPELSVKVKRSDHDEASQARAAAGRSAVYTPSGGNVRSRPNPPKPNAGGGGAAGANLGGVARELGKTAAGAATTYARGQANQYLERYLGGKVI